MNTKLIILFVFVGTLACVVSRSPEKRYMPVIDHRRCSQLNEMCDNKLADVGNLLDNNNFAALVTNGNLNIDCSEETRTNISNCIIQAGRACVNYLGFSPKLRSVVYNFICTKKDAFISAEACLSSGVPDEARVECDVGAGSYANEEKCSADQSCVRGKIASSGACTSRDAILFRDMIRKEYSTQMGVFQNGCALRYFR